MNRSLPAIAVVVFLLLLELGCENPDTTSSIEAVSRVEATASLTHESPITFLAFGPQGKSLVALQGDDGAIVVWDWESQEILNVVKTFSPAKDMAVSPDGELAALAKGHFGVELWDLTTGKKDEELEIGEDFLSDVCVVSFSRDGELLAAADRVGNVAVWKVEGRYELTKSGTPFECINDIDLDGDGELVMVGRAESAIGGSMEVLCDAWKSWGLKERDYEVTSVAYAPQWAPYFILGGADGELTVNRLTVKAGVYPIKCIAQAPSSTPAKNLFAICGGSSEIELWLFTSNMSGGKLDRLKVLDKHESIVTCVAFSPSGLLASASTDGQILVWTVPPP